jgi:hypothetical protein
MNTERVKVLHVANRDTIVGAISDNLVFDFFPSLEGLLNEDLRSQGQGTSGEGMEFFSVICETGSETTKRVC